MFRIAKSCKIKKKKKSLGFVSEMSTHFYRYFKVMRGKPLH